MANLKNWSNIEFPLRARFIRHSDRLYLPSDFQDGEMLTFYSKCEKPVSNALGYRLYYGEHSKMPRLIKYSDIEWN